MQINATITGIQYQILLKPNLEKIAFKKFDINSCPTSCIIIDDKTTFAISKWVSPKRTRSYPYERVYNTLSNGKKITVIPVIKDEGLDGDRDFVQWDTISLMSLLDVYVILAYYDKAEKSKNYNNKIAQQEFNNQYILNKIQQISAYHSSALHWNLKELKDDFSQIVSQAKISYANISEKLKIRMHNEKGIDDFQKIISSSIKEFVEFSRQKSKNAQNRELVTLQPKESLQTLTKTKITIENYLGGQYFLTVDETKIERKTIYLIEGKHSKSGSLPSKSDIKDGLLKMILYTNLKDVKVDRETHNAIPILLLTSSKLESEINSGTEQTQINNFFKKNKFKNIQIEWIKLLFEEAKLNGFLVRLQKG